MAETIGFEKAYVAILGDDEKIVAGAAGLSTNGVFTIDATTSKGTLAATISGLAPTSTKIYGSDIVVDILKKGSGNIEATLGANDIPEAVLNQLAGMKKDTKSGAYYIDKDTTAPYAAVVFVSTASDGKKLYFALPKGTFGPEDKSLNTNTDTSQRQTDSVKFSALNRLLDGRIYLSYKEDGAAVTEASVLKDVFQGYNPSPAELAKH